MPLAGKVKVCFSTPRRSLNPPLLGGNIKSLTNSTSNNLVIGRTYGAGITIQRTNNDGAISAINLQGPSELYGSICVTQNGELKYLNQKTNKESEWNFGCSTLAELKAALANV